MTPRLVLAAVAAAVAGLAAWVGGSARPAADGWAVVYAADGLTVRRAGTAYRLESAGRSVLIDAPVGLPAATAVDQVLLTHHHRDSVSAAEGFVKAGVTVRAAPASAEWLKPDAVTAFWAKSVPLRDSRTAHFVMPVGIDGIDYSLTPDAEIRLGVWTLTPVPTPGHSRDHTAFVARRGTGRPLVFAGDAVTGTGTLWTPFTTDWDHWTDAGLKPAAESLRTLAKLAPKVLFPARGPVVTAEPAKFLTATADKVAEAAFLKSFERFSDRLGNSPRYAFLVPKEQVGSGGDKPWSRVSPSVWITGNTYVVKAAAGNAVLVLDPWGQRSVDQVTKLLRDEQLGPVEVVAFSHAHYDHFDGVYTLPGKYAVWALDTVAEPLADPFRFRAPFLDPRPIRFDKTYRDGETAVWGGYTFKFHHLPGQTWFTAALEETIDGKRCVFTADNFFHREQYSGSGGWMGLNRSSPATYAASAKKVLDLRPEWVLAEHGGPYVFDAEDYRRRVAWGEAAARACDALSPSGDHRRDWDPHQVGVTPVRVTAKPGGTVGVTLVGDCVLEGRGIFPDVRGPGPVTVRLPADVRPGRHVFSVRPAGPDAADPTLTIDVE